MALKHIKAKIYSVKKTSTVTRAMQAVSAVKMRKAQERAIQARPYASAAFQILRSLAHTSEVKSHPLTETGRKGQVAILVITSDKGLAGSFNSAVLKKIEQFLKGRNFQAGEVIFYCLGKRGYEFALARGYEVGFQRQNVSDDIDIDSFRQITEQMLTAYRGEKIREVYAAYTNFKSIFEQHAQIHKVLPLSEEIVKHIVADMQFILGRYGQVLDVAVAPTYTIEPEAREVIDGLLPLLVNAAIYHKLLESKASEHSARMVAMKSATDKAKEMSVILTRKYNKVRQAAITREVSEITSGIEAMR